MKTVPLGITLRESFATSADQTAAAAGNAGVEVISSVALILYIEEACYHLIAAYYEAGELTVGTRVALDHAGAALPGRPADVVVAWAAARGGGMAPPPCSPLVGLRPQTVESRIRPRTLLAQLLEPLGMETARHAAVYAVLDKRDKMPAEVFLEQINTLGLGEEQRAALLKLGEARGPEGLAMIEQLLGGNQPDESPLGRLKRVLGLLKLMKVGDYCVFDPGIIRGLAYYTGIVFEAYSKGTLGRAICGGGFSALRAATRCCATAAKKALATRAPRRAFPWGGGRGVRFSPI